MEITSVKLFSIVYMLNSKNRISTHIFNWYLSNEKNTPFHEKILFFFSNFFLQLFIKTVRGPLHSGKTF